MILFVWLKLAILLLKKKVPINRVKGTFWKNFEKNRQFWRKYFFENLQDFCLEDFGQISSFKSFEIAIFS